MVLGDEGKPEAGWEERTMWRDCGLRADEKISDVAQNGRIDVAAG